MSFNAANILTASRLILTPFFVAAFLTGHKHAAFIIFCVAGFTDLIDGSVARFLKQPSKGGALLDPLADKFLAQSCFALLLSVRLIPAWFFAIALARDIMIVSGIIYLEIKKAALPYRPTWVSKFATLFQLSLAVLGLIIWWRPDLAGALLVRWYFGMIICTAILIAASGVQYVRLGIRIAFNHAGENK